MENLLFLKEHVILGNELWRFLAVVFIFFIFLSCSKISRLILKRKIKKNEEIPEKELFAVFLDIFPGPASLFLIAIGFHLAMLALKLTPAMRGTTDTVSRILFMLTMAFLMYNAVSILDFFVRKWTEKTRTKMDDMLAPMIQKSLRVTILVLVALFVIESLSGKPIGTLLAGLGVGGLAVALAAQETIKNFFGSLVIMSDQPFQVGDRVKIAGHDGPVESVGFRSTRIRTLEGHLVTIPNSEVANQAIQNIGLRPYIRRLTNITITYDTPPEKVERAVEILREILDNHEGMLPDRPPRVYFSEFNDVSLNLVLIYWYAPPDYWMFMEFSHKVNMEILRRFNEEGIDFAFPTQTIHLAGDPKRELALRLLEQQTEVS